VVWIIAGFGIATVLFITHFKYRDPSKILEYRSGIELLGSEYKNLK
jgi:hypothetical protein